MILIPTLIGLAAAVMAQTAQTPPAEAPTLEAQVLAGINEVRADPPAYAEKLRRYRSYFEGDVVHLPGSDVGVRTREGVAAVDQAIAFLSRQPPAPVLRAAPELEASARELASHQALVGGIGHAAADGSDAKVRIKRAKGSGLTAEALAYGARDAESVIRQLIIDDGIPTRPNRKIIFENKYRRAGVACGSHPVNRSVCVVDLATFVGLDPNPKQVRQPPPTVDIR